MKTPYFGVLRLVYVNERSTLKKRQTNPIENGETNNKNLISHSQQNLLHQLYYKTAEAAHKCIRVTCTNGKYTQRMYNR